MTEELHFGREQLRAAGERLKRFAEESPIRAREQRALPRSVPGVGFVTVDLPTFRGRG